MKKISILPRIGLSLACCWSVLAYSASPSPSTGIGEVIVGRTLEDFFTAAISYSPQLKITEEELNISSARKRAAKGLLLPQLNANASRSDNKQQTNIQTQRFDGERYSLQLTQVLFNWEAFLARSQASLIEDQQEAKYFAQLSWLLTDVANKYFDALQADDAYESISSELEAINNQLNQIQSFYDLQLAQITDLYEAQARLAAVQSEALELQNQRALSREALRSVSGVAVGRMYQLGESAQAPSVINNIEYWVEQARSNNQMILASRFALEAANKGVSAKRGAYMPQVSFIAQQQDSNLGFDNVLINQTDFTYFGVNISIPLYAGGRNRAAVREAVSRYSIAESELRQIQLDVGENTRRAFLQIKSSELRTLAAERLVESTVLSATAMQQGFDLGTVSSVDVLNALRDRFSAERDLQQTRYEHIKYYLMLKRESGSLSAADLLEVGNWLVAPGQ